MIRTGHAELPLHPGRCPRWLFERMVPLSREISEALILEFGTDEFLRRISNPFWFQALACTIGFDWHSSGTTTTACGALKMALSAEEHGVGVAGGKGKTSKKAPEEILEISEKLNVSGAERLVRASKLSAKVDNSCVQDGYQLYHHCFFLSEKGKWAVVQQGMNEKAGVKYGAEGASEAVRAATGKNRLHLPDRFGCTGAYARRYHWLSDGISSFVEEPHSGICAQKAGGEVLDMTSRENENLRKAGVDIIKEGPERIAGYLREAERTLKHGKESRQNSVSQQTTLAEYEILELPARHEIRPIDIGKDGMRILHEAYELQPASYEELVSLKGMGPKKIRALALVSNLVYGERISWKDPAKYSFAHGGKDGIPYPVDRGTYDNTIEVLRSAVENARVGEREKLNALKRLSDFVN